MYVNRMHNNMVGKNNTVSVGIITRCLSGQEIRNFYYCRGVDRVLFRIYLHSITLGHLFQTLVPATCTIWVDKWILKCIIASIVVYNSMGLFWLPMHDYIWDAMLASGRFFSPYYSKFLSSRHIISALIKDWILANLHFCIFRSINFFKDLKKFTYGL